MRCLSSDYCWWVSFLAWPVLSQFSFESLFCNTRNILFLLFLYLAAWKTHYPTIPCNFVRGNSTIWRKKNLSNIQNLHNHGEAVCRIKRHGCCVEPISLWYHLCDGSAEGAVKDFLVKYVNWRRKKLISKLYVLFCFSNIV